MAKKKSTPEEPIAADAPAAEYTVLARRYRPFSPQNLDAAHCGESEA